MLGFACYETRAAWKFLEVMSDQSGSAERDPLAPSQPAAAVFGLGMAALIMTIFGFTWLGWGFSAEKTFTVARWMIFYFATLTLLAASVHALRRGKALMKARSAQREEFWARTGKRFRLVTVLEGVGCGIVVLLTIVFHRLDLLAAGISLVVGIHFLPMAGLFRFPAYYATGIAIILCDLYGWALLRSDAITVFVGISTGTVLWVTAIYALIRSHKFFRNVATD
jgi:hypothetical protein